MTPAPSRRARHLLAPVVAVLMAAVLVLAVAGPAAAKFYHGADRQHIAQTLSEFAQTPPTAPVVYLLGGSAARESITDEPGWSAQIAAMGGGRVVALDFGSSSQTFADDIGIVRAAPAVPSIVLIGLNVGRYTTQSPETPASGARSVATAVYDPHRFHVGSQLGDAAKRAIVRQWLVVKYPRFRRRYAGDYAALRALIQTCQEKGFYPVLLEEPVNLAIIGHAWDGARNRYRRDARAAAADFGIPYVDFVPDIGLTSSDFVDVSHLVEPGRAKYQRRLSRLVVTWIEQYGLRAE